MSSVNGIGVRYFGWKHLSDGTAEATQWFTVLYMPVAPIARHHLRVLTDPREESFFSFRHGLAVVTEYEVLDRIPIDWGNALRTYCSAYLLLPILLAAPMVLLFFVCRLIYGNPPRPHEPSTIEKASWITVVVCFIVYWITVIHQALRRSRGFKTNRQEQELEAEREFQN